MCVVTDDADAGTRERILDVALKLFATRGYEGTSIRDIAEQMHMTKAAIYYHFPAKDQILANILFPALGRLDALLSAHDAAEGPIDLRGLVGELIDVIAEVGPKVVILLDDPAVGSRIYKIANESAVTDRIERILARSSAGSGASAALTSGPHTVPGSPLTRRIRAACAVAAIPAGVAAWQESDRGSTAIDDHAKQVLVDIVLAIMGSRT